MGHNIFTNVLTVVCLATLGSVAAGNLTCPTNVLFSVSVLYSSCVRWGSSSFVPHVLLMLYSVCADLPVNLILFLKIYTFCTIDRWDVGRMGTETYTYPYHNNHTREQFLVWHCQLPNLVPVEN